MSQKTSYQTNYVSADNASEIGRLQLIIKTALSGVRTSIPVQIIAVTNAGGVSPIGTVNVQPMVSSVDGSGQIWAHGIIHNVPYMRIQGGANGIILDPQINDIGIATVCDRDLSTVQNVGVKINPATGHNFTSAPGSNRKNDMSDMVYLMTIIGQAPTQYIQFNSAGITITSPTAVTINADVTINGTLTNNGHLVGSTHTHGGVQTGSGQTGVPV